MYKELMSLKDGFEVNNLLMNKRDNAFMNDSMISPEMLRFYIQARLNLVQTTEYKYRMGIINTSDGICYQKKLIGIESYTEIKNQLKKCH
jgi:hypothetical protein